MSEEFQFFDSYEDYIMNYLTQIESESDDILDMLSHKNTKFLFYQFNQYSGQIRQPLKLIRHSVIAENNYALTVIQEKKLSPDNDTVYIDHNKKNNKFRVRIKTSYKNTTQKSSKKKLNERHKFT